MHPPFFHVDHKVDPVPRPKSARLSLRRTRPARLEMTVSAYGFAQVPMRAPPAPKVFPTVQGPIVLTVVPPPRRSLRDRIGRMLIRIGQRMIFENHVRRV